MKLFVCLTLHGHAIRCLQTAALWDSDTWRNSTLDLQLLLYRRADHGTHALQAVVSDRALRESNCPFCAGQRPCSCNSLAALHGTLMSLSGLHISCICANRLGLDKVWTICLDE